MTECLALESLCTGLEENHRSILLSWWQGLPPQEQEALEELTHAFAPWEIKLLPFDIYEEIEEDAVNDLYEFNVAHEIKGGVYFWGAISRDGHRGHFTRSVDAISVLDPLWPPFPESSRYRVWKLRGKLANADLGFA
jgi:hypothetical protein